MKLQNIIWILAILIVAAFYSSPYISVYNLRKAAEQNDFAKLEEYIEFPTLKENFKVKLRAVISKGLGEKIEPAEPGNVASQIGSLGQVIVNALIDPLVNGLITPEVVSAIIRGDKPSNGLGNIKAGNDAAPVESDGVTPAPQNEIAKSGRPFKEIKIIPGYSSLKKFKVRISDPNNANSEIIMTMKRKNLFTWSVYDMDIPALNKIGENISSRLNGIGKKPAEVNAAPINNSTPPSDNSNLNKPAPAAQ